LLYVFVGRSDLYLFGFLVGLCAAGFLARAIGIRLFDAGLVTFAVVTLLPAVALVWLFPPFFLNLASDINARMPAPVRRLESRVQSWISGVRTTPEAAASAPVKPRAGETTGLTVPPQSGRGGVGGGATPDGAPPAPVTRGALPGEVGTTTILTLSRAHVFAGSDVVCSALIAPESGDQGSPTGSVLFLDEATPISSADIEKTAQGGVASLTINTLAPGIHRIRAQYVGSGRFSSSTSQPVLLIIS
jgi:hypothetical protein